MENANDCQAFIQHLRIEHRQLHDVAQKLRDSLKMKTAARRAAAVCDGATQLRDELARHLEMEQRGGLMEEAVSRCPSLGPRADMVQAEHVELLRTLDELLQLASSGTREMIMSANFRSKVNGFLQQLSTHEASEARVLEHGFAVALEDDVIGSR